MEIGHAKQRVQLAAVGSALLISDCPGCLYSLGAEKANLTTAKLTYASLGGPRWDHPRYCWARARQAGRPDQGQVRPPASTVRPSLPQCTWVSTYPSSGETLAAEMSAPCTSWAWWFLSARSHLV